MNLRNLLTLLMLLSIADCIVAQSYLYYVPCYDKGKYGYSDTLGNIVITPQFPYADLFGNNGFAGIYATDDEKNISSIPEIQVQNNNPKMTMGVINAKGKIVVPNRYHMVSLRDQYFITRTHTGKAGAYTRSGVQAFKDVYDYINAENNIAVAQSGSRIQIIRFNPKTKACIPVLNTTGDYTQFEYKNHQEVSGIRIHTKTAVRWYDTLGKLIKKETVKPTPELSTHIPSTDAGWAPEPMGRTGDIGESKMPNVYKSGAKYGFLTRAGTRDTVTALYDILIPARGKLYRAKKQGMWGLTDIDGRSLIACIYDSLGWIEKSGQGYICAVKQNGRWGLAHTGNPDATAVPCLYDSTGVFYKSGDGFSTSGKRVSAPEIFILKKDSLYGLAIKQQSSFLLIEPRYRQILNTEYLGDRAYMLFRVLDTRNKKIWINSQGFEYSRP